MTLSERELHAAMPSVRNALTNLCDVLDDRSLDVPQRAAALAAVWQLKLLLERRLSLPKRELAEAFERSGTRQIGPLVLGSKPEGVEWPANDPANWSDVSVQSALADLHGNPLHSAYVRLIPRHFEVDTAALGAGVRDRLEPALELHRSMKLNGWRTERGRTPILVLRP